MSEEKKFLVEKADWDKIKDSSDKNDFYAFLEKYPNGFISIEANFRLNQLEKAKILTQRDKNGVQQDPNKVLYHLGDRIRYVRTDYLTGNELGRREVIVQEIKQGKVFLSNGFSNGIVLSESGAVYSNTQPDGGVDTYDPPLSPRPLELQIGMSWVDQSIQKSTRYEGARDRIVKNKVVAFEEIKVPAGTFKAFKIESSVTVGGGGGGFIYNWLVPDNPYPIKTVRNIRDRMNRPLNYDVTEAVSIKLEVN